MSEQDHPISVNPAKPTTQEDWDVLRRRECHGGVTPRCPNSRDQLLCWGAWDNSIRCAIRFINGGVTGFYLGNAGSARHSVNVLPLFFPKSARQTIQVRVNASPDETFTSLWRKVFRRIDYRADDGANKKIVDDYPGEITPDDVQLELSSIGESQTLIVVLDEFDRIASRDVTTKIADSIKSLSDYSVSVTIVIVGVAEDVSELIQGMNGSRDH